MKRSRWILFGFFLTLCTLALAVSVALMLPARGAPVLSVSFLAVGQGDATLIQSPTGTQVIIDAGGTREVLRQLPAVMGWFDRSIDIALATHPDQDHIGGFPDLLSRYRVGLIVHSSVEDDGSDARAFAAASQEEGVLVRVAERGDVFDLGGGALLEVLFPDRPVPDIETNTGSVIARLTYGDTSFLFTGDAPSSVEQYLVHLDGERLRSDVLKVGHHGSRTSSHESFLEAVNPAVAVISRGCDNRYGHPHEEVVQRFESFRVQLFDTCEDGTVTFVSDGNSVVRK